VTHKSGLARTQIALQGDESIGDGGALCQRRRKAASGGFVHPMQCGRRAFYNGVVTKICTQFDGNQLVSLIQAWARELGFSQIGVTGVDLTAAEPGLQAWLACGYHGSMHYMERHGLKRARPQQLVPGTVSVITARMDYLPRDTPADWAALEWQRLQDPAQGVVSVYARGRDYHKVLRSRLQTLSERIAAHVGPLGYRVFTDSAPVLEAELAVRSGQGWRGKHTLVLNRDAGSMFFLGEIFVDVALPPSMLHPPEPAAHCGTCTACMDVCPTRAIVGPQQVDARRCISYLTIEHAGEIPLELRPLMGNHVYGCDDCQLTCPWNKYAQRSTLPDFDSRPGMQAQAPGAGLITWLCWSEVEFLQRTEGSPVRRIGHAQWQRNVVVAMGNALRTPMRADMIAALHTCDATADALVRSHISWALAQAAPSKTL
jgi:epoxyqueuosine reductase